MNTSIPSGLALRPEPCPEEIRAQVDRIVESAEFPSIGRGTTFLKYVVEEALSGRANRIKGYSIAVEVFKRAESFTQDDPVVRIEAGRLRRSLERYYLTAGAHDAILVTIPKGGYVPHFAWTHELDRVADIAGDTTAADPTPAPLRPPFLSLKGVAIASLFFILSVTAGAFAYAALIRAVTNHDAVASTVQPDGPTLAVIPFTDMGGGSQATLYAKGLTEDLLTALPKFKELKVFGRETSQNISPNADAKHVRHALGARYILGGSVRTANNKLRATARLSDTATGKILWSATYDEDLASRNLFAIQTDVANKVATAVAQPYGAISLADATNPPPDDFDAYWCTLRFYEYSAELSAAKHLEVRDCLESAVARFPAYGTAWAMLSIVYLDEERYGYNRALVRPHPFDEALRSARKAVQLDPENSRALQALMMALFFNQQIEDGLRVGEQALVANPNDTQLISEFGTRLALSGQWHRGADLIKQALARNPGAAGYYHAVLGLAAYMQKDYPTAVFEIEQGDLQKFPMYHIVAAVIYAEVGRMDDARREGEIFIRMRPSFIPNIASELSLRNIPPSDQARLIEGIRKVGLKVPPAG